MILRSRGLLVEEVTKRERVKKRKTMTMMESKNMNLKEVLRQKVQFSHQRVTRESFGALCWPFFEFLLKRKSLDRERIYQGSCCFSVVRCH
ncbi:unnamed protein product [Camellia sinensis]